jgi:hypothetical protein
MIFKMNGYERVSVTLFAWFISHQAAVLFSHNSPATSSTLLSEQTSTSHQPLANRTGCMDQPVRFAYQPPANSTFLSEQTSHQQPVSSTFLSK